MSNDTLSKVGEIDIVKADLYSFSGKRIDISLMIADFTLFEDLFANTLSGYLVLEDSLNLLSGLPLIGQELFDLEVKTPTLNKSIKKSFAVYKMSARTTDKNRLSTYVLHLCTPELLNSANTKISRSFKGNITDTVKEIFTSEKYLASKSKLFVDPTKNSYQFIPAYWTAFETINWLSDKAINERGVPNYLFYETNQSFEFASMDLLMQYAPERNYVFSDIDSSTAFGTNGQKELKYDIVEEITSDVTFDYLRNLSGGMYASQLYTYDMTTKSIVLSSFDYLDDFAKSKHLNENPVKATNLIRNKIASQYHIEKNDYLFSTYKKQGYKERFLFRNSLMEQLSAYKIVIKVPGRTDVKIGNIVNLKIPEFRQFVASDMTSGEFADDNYSGNYLVTAIRHQIISGIHTMHLEIILDSFVKKLTL